MRLKVSSAKWRPFCLDLNVLSSNFREVQSWDPLSVEIWCSVLYDSSYNFLFEIIIIINYFDRNN